jgi:predicted NAD-dependent protein-ADP-ribosyltransferase YbiA (DUF1768 family)
MKRPSSPLEEDVSKRQKKNDCEFTKHEGKITSNVYYVECLGEDELHCLHNMYTTRIKYKGLYYSSVEAAYQAQKFPLVYRELFSEHGIFSDWRILKSNLFFGEKRGAQIIEVFRNKGMIGIIAKLVGIHPDISARFHLRPLEGVVKMPKEEWLKLLWAKFSDPALKAILLGHATRGRPIVSGASRSELVKKGGYSGKEILIQYDGLKKDDAAKIGVYGAHVNQENVVVGYNFNGNLLMLTRRRLLQYDAAMAAKTVVNDENVDDDMLWDTDCEEFIGTTFDELF